MTVTVFAACGSNDSSDEGSARRQTLQNSTSSSSTMRNAKKRPSSSATAVATEDAPVAAGTSSATTTTTTTTTTTSTAITTSRKKKRGRQGKRVTASTTKRKRNKDESNQNKELKTSHSKNDNKKIDTSNSNSSSHDGIESDPEISLDIPPDYDGESSKSHKHNRCLGTVHWNPNSSDGAKVGYRIRVYDFGSSKQGCWKHGRIVRYDPISHKHKVVFFGDTDNDENDEEKWLMLKNENIQLGGSFVWALVKGFAWWPAQILHCHFGRQKPGSNVRDLTTQPVRDGYVLVEFFDSDEVAAIRNTPDFLRHFKKGSVDAVIAKNKKKKNQMAIDSGIQEELATQDVRNDAAKFYAECAFKCANRKANYFLGMKIEVFRQDINYPVGAKLVGTVRQYSLTSKKWFIAYDPFPVNKEQYSPSWINLLNKSNTYKIIDDIRGSKRKLYEPNDDDIFPFLFGYEDEDGSFTSKCRGCIAECNAEKEVVLQCAECSGCYHPGCIDPPISSRSAESMVKSGEKWVCNKCVRCTGCRELEITYGTKTIAQPSSLYLEDGVDLALCVACIPMYEKEMFCPTCAHIWDDVRFQRIQKRVKKMKKIEDVKTKKIISNSDDEQKDVGFQWNSPNNIDDSWFYPEEINVWGYNEGAMLYCEQCKLWVHAACAEMSEKEYEQTNEGLHPIYSKEFLCRTCCKRKCLSLVNMLVQEDKLLLFAEPVTDKVAHNYNDIIKNPMDLQTMTQRAQEGACRNYAWLRESFELMVYNALTFNIGYSTYWNEAKRFYGLCTKKVFAIHGKGAPPSKYVEMIINRFAMADKAVQAEKDRIKADVTAEKKDLVAGSQVLKVDLQSLEKPADPSSCVPCCEVRLSRTEALFCSWMDTCFTCGSSGSADTFLFCVDCGEAYHSYCCMAPIHSMNESAVSGWRCPNCKLCEITGESTEDETKLIYCEMCDRAFSIDKIEPPLASVPEGLWICGQCVDCTVCKNHRCNGDVSRTSWSNDPSICRGCAAEKKILKKKRSAERRLLSSASKKSSKNCSKDKSKEVVIKATKAKKKLKVVVEAKKLKKKIKKIKKELKKKEGEEPKKVKEIKTKEDVKEQALIGAMKEAQSRGLPDGWTCFYGAANRKRWRAPPPHSRVFDSIPKALQYVERKKNGSSSPLKLATGQQMNKKPFVLFDLRLDEIQEWQERERGYDDNTALMSDAETLYRILNPKVGVNFCQLLDPSSATISPIKELQDEPRWVFQRAARFIRFVKRLSKKNQKHHSRGMIKRASQMVVCKMASSFIYVVCRIFNVDIIRTIKSSLTLESFLVPLDEHSGTVALNLPIKKHRIHRKGGIYEYKFALGKGKYDPNLKNNNPPPDVDKTQNMAIGLMNGKSNIISERKQIMSEQDYDIANVLLGLTSTGRSSQKQEMSTSVAKTINQVEVMTAMRVESTQTDETGDMQTHTVPVQPSTEAGAKLIYDVEVKPSSEVEVKETKDVAVKPISQVEVVSSREVEVVQVNDVGVKASRAVDVIPTNTAAANPINQVEVMTAMRVESTQTDETGDMQTHTVPVQPSTEAGAKLIYDVEVKPSSEVEVKETKDVAVKPTNDIQVNEVQAELPNEVTVVPVNEVAATPSNEVGASSKDDVVMKQTNEVGAEPSSNVRVKEESEVQAESTNFVAAKPTNELEFKQSKEVKAKSTCVIEGTSSKQVQLKTTDVDVKVEDAGNDAVNARKVVIDDGVKEKIIETKVKMDKEIVRLPWLSSEHTKVHPMLGWKESREFGEWKDPRMCCLCLTCADDDAGLEPIDDTVVDSSCLVDSNEKVDIEKARGAGRLLPIPNGGWIHANCAIWSSEVWETQNGSFLNDVQKARGRSTKLKCFGCGRPGATLGCHKGNCVKNYHFVCARASGMAFMDNHKLYCNSHKSSVKGPLRIDFSEPMKPLKVAAQKDIEIDMSLSIRCGGLVVHSLGQIQMDIDGFHTKKYIVPPGFTSTRIFWSYKRAKTRTLYFMRIERSSSNLPFYTLTTADAPSFTYRGDNVTKVYMQAMEQVRKINSKYFSKGDLCSIFPIERKWKKGQKSFCMNGPQFWGFGIDNVRKALEELPQSVACVVPLTEKSIPYRFCFKNPSEDAVRDLQRKRAAIKAEKALENLSGCARTEGEKAVDKSTSSDRITRALVRKLDDYQGEAASTKSGSTAKILLNSNKNNFESDQAKYREMKKYPMEQRLAAKRSHIHGWGLFAKIFFPKNSMIAEYMGEAIGQTIADKRERKYEVLGMGSCYMFRLDKYNIVDATNIGCMARFMNHCCAANAFAKIITVNTSIGLEKKIVVFAKQDIQIGEEITYDYNFAAEDGSLRCTCGAPNCTGRMN